MARPCRGVRAAPSPLARRGEGQEGQLQRGEEQEHTVSPPGEEEEEEEEMEEWEGEREG